MPKIKYYSPSYFSRGLTVSKFLDSFSSPGPGSYNPKFIEKEFKNNDWMFRPRTSHKLENNKLKEKEINSNYKYSDFYNVREKYVNESKKPRIKKYSFPKASRFADYDKKYKNNIATIKPKSSKNKKLFREENNYKGDEYPNIIKFEEEKNIKGDNASQLNKNKKNLKQEKEITEQENSVPGVGKYNLRSSLEVPVVKFGTEKKGLTFDKIVSPGPGKYNMREKEYGKTKVEYSIPKAEKIEPRPWTPGPGKYDPRINSIKISSSKYSFPKNPKLKYFYNSNPAPNKYDTSKKFGEDALKITMSPCPRREIKYNGNPGPNKYKPDFEKIKKTYPRYIMSKDTRKELYNIDPSFPGPNKYLIKDGFNSKNHKAPKWKIGTGKRPPLYNNNKTPGVGMYSLRKSYNEGIKYSLRWKYSIKNKEKRPGVGQYNVSKSSQITLKKEPQWKIGTALKDDRILGKNGNPGPGMYSIPCSMVDVNNYTREKGNFDKNFRYI